MQDNQAEFHSIYGRRRNLVVDDEENNRALLGGLDEP